MFVEVHVQRLGMDASTQSPVVLLREVEGERVLPIWIGSPEAGAIAMHLSEVPFTRPLTHDLLVAVLRDLGGELVCVRIDRVENNTYFAHLEVRQGVEVRRIDARPSDSIAVALRLAAPIFVAEALLDRIEVELEGPERGGDDGPDDLEEYLRGLDPEDFGRFRP